MNTFQPKHEFVAFSVWLRESSRVVCGVTEEARGQTEVKDKLLNFALQADPAAEAEPVSLVSSRPGLRPADVLTAGAIQGTMAALDVGVTAPSGADGDVHCTERYKQIKFKKYGKHLAGLMRKACSTNL